MNNRRKQEREADIDGIVFNGDLDDILEDPYEAQEEIDDMMVDAIAREEEAELEAMLSLLNTGSSSQALIRPDTPSLSDDEDYDTLFMDILSQERGDGDEFVCSGQMDMS